MFQSMLTKYGSSRTRIAVSRVVAGLLILLQIATYQAKSVETGDILLWTIGVCLIVLAMLGRMWASLFISGRKTHQLVMTGPYSVVRNPLYLSSLLGIFGIGLISNNAIFAPLLLAAFFAYYPGVIRAEEKKLLEIHGEEFRRYTQKVPRLLPDFHLYSSPETLEIDISRVLRTARDSLAFLAASLVLLLLNYVRLAYPV